MKEIQIFNNPQFGEIRVQQSENGEPLFCAVDVAKALGYSNPSKAVIDHCKGVTVLETPTTNQWGAEVIQNIKYVKESDVYRLVMKSKAPNAEKFQDWVCEEVLPSIRKTGIYSIKGFQTPKTFADALLLAYNQQKEIEEKTLLLEAQAPKVGYYDDVMMSESTMTTTQVAKTLGRSGQWLNRQLKSCGLIFFQSGQWLVKSPYDRCGLHKVRTSTYTKSDGLTASKSSTVWTEKGKRFIIALFDCGFKLSSAVAIMRQEQGKGAVAV